MDRSQRHSYVLLGMVQSHAPDGRAQEMVAQIYRRLEGADLSEDQITITMAGMLLDGLRHGNWPWVEYNTAAIQS